MSKPLEADNLSSAVDPSFSVNDVSEVFSACMYSHLGKSIGTSLIRCALDEFGFHGCLTDFAEEEIDLGSQDESDESEDSEEDDPGDGGGALVFPASFCAALAQILMSEKPVAVKDIKIEDKEERAALAYSLWCEGFVRTIEAASQPKTKTQKKQKKK